MSNTSKIVIGIVVVILIIVGVIWYMGKSGAPAASNTAAVATTTTQPVAVAPAPLDTTDAGINSDLTNIDAQMNGLNTDNTDTATLSAKQ